MRSISLHQHQKYSDRDTAELKLISFADLMRFSQRLKPLMLFLDDLLIDWL